MLLREEMNTSCPGVFSDLQLLLMGFSSWPLLRKINKPYLFEISVLSLMEVPVPSTSAKQVLLRALPQGRGLHLCMCFEKREKHLPLAVFCPVVLHVSLIFPTKSKGDLAMLGSDKSRGEQKKHFVSQSGMCSFAGSQKQLEGTSHKMCFDSSFTCSACSHTA